METWDFEDGPPCSENTRWHTLTPDPRLAYKNLWTNQQVVDTRPKQGSNATAWRSDDEEAFTLPPKTKYPLHIYIYIFFSFTFYFG